MSGEHDPQVATMAVETRDETYAWATSPEAETLRPTRDEAVEELLLGMDTEQWPTVLKVLCWQRCVVKPEHRRMLADAAAEELLERLDEEYGNPDGDTPKRLMAHARGCAFIFVDEVLKHYRVWQCDRRPEGDVEINVADWVRNERAAWLARPEVVAFVRRTEGGS